MILLNSDACFREHKIKGILRKLIEIVCRWDRLCASVSVNSSPELGVSEDADHASWSAGKVSLVTSVNPLFDPASIYECDLDDDDDCIPLLHMISSAHEQEYLIRLIVSVYMKTAMTMTTTHDRSCERPLVIKPMIRI